MISTMRCSCTVCGRRLPAQSHGTARSVVSRRANGRPGDHSCAQQNRLARGVDRDTRDVTSTSPRPEHTRQTISPVRVAGRASLRSGRGQARRARGTWTASCAAPTGKRSHEAVDDPIRRRPVRANPHPARSRRTAASWPRCTRRGSCSARPCDHALEVDVETDDEAIAAARQYLRHGSVRSAEFGKPTRILADDPRRAPCRHDR